MKNKIILSAALLSLSLSSCSAFKGDKSEDEIKISTYKGGEITEKEAKAELRKLVVRNKKLRGLTFDKLSDAQKKIIIKEAVINEISYKEAKKRKLHKEKEYKEALNLFKKEFLKQRLLASLRKDATSDELVKAKYDTLVEKLKGQKEINIRYIILGTEKKAKFLAKKLSKSPRYFSTQAKRNSLDKKTGKKGGNLGFVLESQLPAQIVEAAKTLKKGQVAKTPVALGDKWVVVGFEGQRDAQISEFKDVKAALAKALAQKAIKDFISKNLKEADITFTEE